MLGPSSETETQPCPSIAIVIEGCESTDTETGRCVHPLQMGQNAVSIHWNWDRTMFSSIDFVTELRVRHMKYDRTLSSSIGVGAKVRVLQLLNYDRTLSSIKDNGAERRVYSLKLRQYALFIHSHWGRTLHASTKTETERWDVSLELAVFSLHLRRRAGTYSVRGRGAERARRGRRAAGRSQLRLAGQGRIGVLWWRHVPRSHW